MSDAVHMIMAKTLVRHRVFGETTSLADFLRQDWDLCVECAGQPAVRESAAEWSASLCRPKRDCLAAPHSPLPDPSRLTVPGRAARPPG